MKMNPWEKLQRPSKLIDIEEEAFSKASKAAKKILYYKNKVYTAKKREKKRIEIFCKVLVKHLKRCYDVGREFYKAHRFYKELISLYYPEEEIIKNVKRIKGLIDVLNNLKREYIHKISLSDDTRNMSLLRKEAMGRMISVIKRRYELITFFTKMLMFARKLPSIDNEIPLIVVAGPPNVGKSSLVKIMSTAEPEVAEYPFTTKMITLGHFTINNITVQIMDTPGLLDRPMEERNEIEKQAILALKYVSDIVIFMFDPSPTRYYPIKRQKNILLDIKNNFKDIYIIEVVNKIDIANINIDDYFDENVIKISVLTRKGLDTLQNKIKQYILSIKQNQFKDFT